MNKCAHCGKETERFVPIGDQGEVICMPCFEYKENFGAADRDFQATEKGD